MKKILLMCILCMVSLAGFSPSIDVITIPKSAPIEPYEAIWKAVCTVESLNNPNAYNALEQATGIAQIRPVRLYDYNIRTGHSYSLQDCFSPKVSKAIFLYYATIIGYRDADRIIRDWNGSGPDTYVYLNKVKKYLL